MNLVTLLVGGGASEVDHKVAESFFFVAATLVVRVPIAFMTSRRVGS